MNIIKKYKALPVSDEFLLSRLPTDSPMTLMFSITEPQTKTPSGKSRSVRISKSRIKKET